MSTMKAPRRTFLGGIALFTIARAGFAGAAMRAGCANGFRPAMSRIAGEFQPAMEVDYAEGAVLLRRLLEGERFDVVILARSSFDGLMPQGIVLADSVIDLAATDRLGVAVRRGDALPDDETVGAFRRWLLGLKSVALTNPAVAGAAGRQFLTSIERLGIAEEIKGRLILTPGGPANVRLVTSGEAQAAVQLSHLLSGVDGLAVVSVPAEFRGTVIFAAGVVAGTPDQAAAISLMKFLRGPVAAQAIEASGMRRSPWPT
jgi:molybdate transport system substrate-binding protein